MKTFATILLLIISINANATDGPTTVNCDSGSRCPELIPAVESALYGQVTRGNRGERVYQGENQTGEACFVLLTLSKSSDEIDSYSFEVAIQDAARSEITSDWMSDFSKFSSSEMTIKPKQELQSSWSSGHHSSSGQGSTQISFTETATNPVLTSVIIRSKSFHLRKLEKQIDAECRQLRFVSSRLDPEND